jgi:hypothetical protein
MKYLALTLPGDQVVQPPGGIPTGGIQTAGGNIVSVGIQLLLIAAVIFSLAFLIYGGYKWITSAGDQEKLASARLTLLYAIAGLVIAFLSFTIIKAIGDFFGINFLSF